MSEKELHSYRFTSMEEPSDELLEEIMGEAAIQARKATAQVEQRVAELIRSAIADAEKEWAAV